MCGDPRCSHHYNLLPRVVLNPLGAIFPSAPPEPLPQLQEMPVRMTMWECLYSQRIRISVNPTDA
jgi:hypothetical protein